MHHARGQILHAPESHFFVLVVGLERKREDDSRLVAVAVYFRLEEKGEG